MYIYKKYYYKNIDNVSYNLLSIFILFILYSGADFIFLLKNIVLFSFMIMQGTNELPIFKKVNDILDKNRNKVSDVFINGIDRVIEFQHYLFEFYDKFYFLLYNDTLNAFLMKKNDDSKLIEMSSMLSDIKNKIKNLNNEIDENEKKIENLKVLNNENEKKIENVKVLNTQSGELDFNELIKMMSENIAKNMGDLKNNSETDEGTNLLDLNKIFGMIDNGENLNFDNITELLNKEETDDDINEFLIK